MNFRKLSKFKDQERATFSFPLFFFLCSWRRSHSLTLVDLLLPLINHVESHNKLWRDFIFSLIFLPSFKTIGDDRQQHKIILEMLIHTTDKFLSIYGIPSRRRGRNCCCIPSTITALRWFNSFSKIHKSQKFFLLVLDNEEVKAKIKRCSDEE